MLFIIFDRKDLVWQGEHLVLITGAPVAGGIAAEGDWISECAVAHCHVAAILLLGGGIARLQHLTHVTHVTLS